VPHQSQAEPIAINIGVVMYTRRIKIFVGLTAVSLAVCVLRLVQMQLVAASSVQENIAELKRRGRQSHQLKTLRGKILDRKGRILAVDEPRFELCISYRLSRFLDERIRKAMILEAVRHKQPEQARSARLRVQAQLEAKLELLQQIINKCSRFGKDPKQVEDKIRRVNDRIWALRAFLAWRRNNPSAALIRKYGGRVSAVPVAEALRDFEQKVTDEDRRLLLINRVNDIPEMDTTITLVELETDADVFAAQVEFMEMEDVRIQPKAQRVYPYKTVAAQTIGWVGPATQPEDLELFAGDRLASYLHGELCGRIDGVEYVCEVVLRGRRGELVYDIDRQLISQRQTQFGKDVRLTIDIELQRRIEQYLKDPQTNPNAKAPTAVAIVEVASGDVLALVSLPSFDLNRARYDYGKLLRDPNKPLINRAVNAARYLYPPGSVIKPVVLIAGLETGRVRADEVISCPSAPAERGWPNCWIYKRYGIGHDNQWQNTARNAIKGSCNLYFSRLADRIKPELLQRWLFNFGYGREVLLAPAAVARTGHPRTLRQSCGVISSTIPTEPVRRFEQVPPLSARERRFFGIGQGSLGVTPLQVATAMATIARGGMFMRPQLFLDDPNEPSVPMRIAEYMDLGISPKTLEVVYDGMYAVVNEPGGTAYKEFAPVLDSLAKQQVKLYGKTGSTESPENAWFAGFAVDGSGRKLALAVVVEGGKHGSQDAAPLARDILQFCIEAGYLGTATN